MLLLPKQFIENSWRHCIVMVDSASINANHGTVPFFFSFSNFCVIYFIF